MEDADAARWRLGVSVPCPGTATDTGAQHGSHPAKGGDEAQSRAEGTGMEAQPGLLLLDSETPRR